MASEQIPLERSPEARALAQQALFGLLAALRGREAPIVVLGGLVPEVLTAGQDPPVPQHLGTTDVDVLVAVHLDAADLAPVEQALRDSKLSPDPKVEGWRWFGSVRGFRVKIEFFCDLDGQPSNVVIGLPGCDSLKAVNLRGTGFAAEDPQWVELTGELADGRTARQRVRFAGLQGYLLSKAHAARHRGEPKDYYDLTYTLLFNKLGGPVEAAAALLDGPFADRLAIGGSLWAELRARFSGRGDIGPSSYAEQASQVEPGSDRAQLAEDAVGAVAAFIDRLQSGER